MLQLYQRYNYEEPFYNYNTVIVSSFVVRKSKRLIQTLISYLDVKYVHPSNKAFHHQALFVRLQIVTFEQYMYQHNM